MRTLAMLTIALGIGLGPSTGHGADQGWNGQGLLR
jgi:hypothetical protein